MFYDTEPYRQEMPILRDDRTHALVNILPREGKRLIAKGVLAIPEVGDFIRAVNFGVSFLTNFHAHEAIFTIPF